MKKVLTSLVLILAAAQVNADGFYQQLIANAPQADKATTTVSSEISYTPLYKQVSASVEQLAAAETHGPNPDFSYTPLYLKVVGPSKPWSVAGKIAKN
ncbi:MAG: hypothetical protein GKR93_16355 [Gammaproteobacteria bacterium]|nr:hypothetical protein [Gammaproteobacteria bacterium]